jgi:broad specificity phosphatase PhoE
MLTRQSFYFLRHGETDWNRQRIIQGQLDKELNATGLSQAAAVRDAVAQLPITTICCSPLLRTRRTMEIVNDGPNKPVVYIPDLMECHLGDFQGQASYGSWRDEWQQGGPMPGGETFLEYSARIMRGFSQALSQPGPVLVVGHGGNFWALEHYGLIVPGTRVTNCALFKLDPPTPGSEFWNVTPLACPAEAGLAIGEGAVL